ncbi:MAG: glycosyltransferase family 4 protein [Pseudonocardia sp.]|nr:glycosyltransferase family 4 protein [Pseudonocardia sp.]
MTDPDRKLKVLLVGKSAPDRGGIPTFLEMLRTGELSRLVDIELLNVAHAGTPEGGKVTGGNIGRTIADALAVYRMARGRDVVHIHSALAPTVTVLRAGLLAAAGATAGAAVVVHAHGGELRSWLSSDRRRALLRTALRPVAKVVAVWSAGLDMLREAFPGERVVLVDNGIELERFRPGPRDHAPPRILYVGLLTPRKGVLDLAEASKILRERGIAHELRLLGGTPDEGPAAEAQVRDNLPEWADLLGRSEPEDVPAVYASADVFCLPSWWEAQPLSILEAMGSGLPVVASDVGDVGRLVEDGRTGFVVPVRDPERLADALEKLLVDASARREMGDAGRRRVEEHFSAEVTARTLERIYREVATRP